LRESNARDVHKTLSFSKQGFYHELVTLLFLVRHNLNTPQYRSGVSCRKVLAIAQGRAKVHFIEEAGAPAYQKGS
jgi:hypothetical protein